jgi:hypothetical protein
MIRGGPGKALGNIKDMRGFRTIGNDFILGVINMDGKKEE